MADRSLTPLEWLGFEELACRVLQVHSKRGVGRLLRTFIQHPGQVLTLERLSALSAKAGSDEALEAFAKRQLKCERLQWANQRHAAPLIEALKFMAEREAGWSQKGSLDEIKARLAVLLEARRHG